MILTFQRRILTNLRKILTKWRKILTFQRKILTNPRISFLHHPYLQQLTAPLRVKSKVLRVKRTIKSSSCCSFCAHVKKLFFIQAWRPSFGYLVDRPVDISRPIHDVLLACRGDLDDALFAPYLQLILADPEQDGYLLASCPNRLQVYVFNLLHFPPVISFDEILKMSLKINFYRRLCKHCMIYFYN